MNNNLTSVMGGLGIGIAQDSPLSIRPYDTLIVTPQLNTNSATVPASTVTQKYVSTWIPNTAGIPVYVQATQFLWALTFPGTTLYQGSPVCVLDCHRNATLTFNVATTIATTVTIYGWDDQGKEVIWTSASQAVGTTAVISAKCFKLIRDVSFTAYPWTVNAATNTVLVRGGTFIGLPTFINNSTSIITAVWAGTNIDNHIIPGAIWRQTSITPPINAATSIPSATSTDARGYADITGIVSAPNGSIVLQVFYYVYGVDEELNKQLNALNGYTTTGIYSLINQPGSSANIVQVKNGSSGKPMLTTLVKQDQYGAQFPGDNKFMDYYNGLYYKV